MDLRYGTVETIVDASEGLIDPRGLCFGTAPPQLQARLEMAERKKLSSIIADNRFALRRGSLIQASGVTAHDIVVATMAGKAGALKAAALKKALGQEGGEPDPTDAAQNSTSSSVAGGQDDSEDDDSEGSDGSQSSTLSSSSSSSNSSGGGAADLTNVDNDGEGSAHVSDDGSARSDDSEGTRRKRRKKIRRRQKRRERKKAIKLAKILAQRDAL
jgi:hypothetical protein